MSVVNIRTPEFINTALVPWSPELVADFDRFVARAAREHGLNAIESANHIVIFRQPYLMLTDGTVIPEGVIINAQVGGDALNPGAQANFGGGVPAPVSLSAQGQNEAPRFNDGSSPPTIDR